MRRRKHLIDRYLQHHDPHPDGERLRAAAPTAAESHPAREPSSRPARAHRLRVALPLAAAAAIAAGAVVVAGLLPSNTPAPARFLRPEGALAAAAANLDTSGVLEWSDMQGAEGVDPAQSGDVITRWVDLETGDASEFHDERFVRGRVEGQPTASLWNMGRTNWLDEGARSKTNGKRIVRKTITDRPPRMDAEEFTPVRKFQRLLDRALNGALPYRSAGSIDGVPVVVITDVRKTYTSRSWVTRERTPRLVKSAFTMPCPIMDGVQMNCSNISDDGSADGGSTGYTRTLTWKIHPRTPEFLAKVHPPEFDPEQYVVLTEHRR